MSLRVWPLIAGLMLGCGGGVIQREGEVPAPPPGTGYLEIECSPKTTELYVDGRFWGVVEGYARHVVQLPEGSHRVELRAPGYYPWYGLIEAGPHLAKIHTHLINSVPTQ